MRTCGDCQLCCRLLPVAGVNKPANQRCRHQRHGKGCAVYGIMGGSFGAPRMPLECKLWSCRWLVGDGTRDLARPDRSHYVLDVMQDFVTVQETPDSEKIKIGALQVWVDPAHPDAHRDPALRAYLARAGAEGGLVAIIRYDSSKGFTLVPPALSPTGDWIEVQSGVETEHSFADVIAMLKAKDVSGDTTPAPPKADRATESGGPVDRQSLGPGERPVVNRGCPAGAPPEAS